LHNVSQRCNVLDMTGTELKLKRIAAHLKGKDVAQAAEWPAYKVSRVESLAHVPPADAERYVAALRTLTTNATQDAA
jgi:hypothetical protein